MRIRTNGGRRPWLGILAASTCIAIVAACNITLFLPPLTAPEGETPVVGGIVDTRPMFGKTIGPDGAEIGEFLLATCGCGQWRVLIKDANGHQAQCAIRYYSAGDYSSDGDIRFFGDENGLKVQGVVDQTAGDACGNLDVDILRRSFTAVRRETHTDDIEACILCHIGDDPIYPQPTDHPVYVEGATNCFDCHDVVIN